jgi:hypothetical protein
MRVAVDMTGTISTLEPPTYHGNPIDACGSLVTIDWGFDIRRCILDASGLDSEIFRLDDLHRGIRAQYVEVIVTTKPALK